MGCGASKATQNDIVETTTPSIKVDSSPMIAPAPVSVPSISSPVDNASAAVEEASVAQGAPIVEVRVPEVADRSEVEANASALSKAKVPSIPVVVSDSGSQPPSKPAAAHKPVAFEIPLDEDLFKPVQPQVPVSEEPVPLLAGDCVVAAPAEGTGSAAARSAGASANSTKLSLPKLDLSSRDIMAKLANTEERWKDLERQEIRRKRKSKPNLTSSSQTTLNANGRPMTAAEATNPTELKQRLLDKEARAAARRARELLKLQTKLAKQEEHARQVQERKKKLGRVSSNDALNLSWGGGEEEEVEKAKAYGAALRDAVGIDGIMKMKLQARKDEGLVLDNDSGKGSSAASVNNGSRSGSGRSLGFAEDGTEIIAPL